MIEKLSHFNKEDGLTIIELLVAIVIMGFVMAIATTMIVQSFNVFRGSSYRMSAGQMAEMALNHTSLYLRSAVDIEELGCLNDKDKIKFEAYHPDHENEVWIEFELEGDNLFIYVAGDDGRLIAYGVNNFCIDEKDENEFSLSIRYSDEEGNMKSKSTSVKSRNM